MSVAAETPVAAGDVPGSGPAGGATPKAAAELLFKVASATVGAIAQEAAKAQTEVAPVPLIAGLQPPQAPQNPRTPQKPQQQPKGRRTPKSGQTPKTQTPQTWGSTPTSGLAPSPVGMLDGDDDSDADSMCGDLSALSPDVAAARSGVGPAGAGRTFGTFGGKGGSDGKGNRQRRQPGGIGAGGPQGFRAGGMNSMASRPPPPPPSGSLKALPAEHVQRFLRLVQEGDYAEALRALRKVRRAVKGRGCSKEAFGGLRALLHHLLEGYSSAGRLSEALELLGDMKQGTEARLVSAAAFNAVLRGLLARGALDEARFIVREEMGRLGVSPNEASLNLLMDTAARAGPAHLDEAWDVLEDMQKRGLRADKYTVSILTKGISERGNDKRRAPRGVALVEFFLKNQPDDVDEVLVNSLLDVFCRMGDMPRLEATLQKMKEYGIKGSAVTYGTIVKAYGRAGSIDKVLQAWEEMQKEGLEANAVTYGCMLDACVKCGHLDRALRVFAVMKENGLHRNTILYATLIKGFAKGKDPLAARDLHKEMVREGVMCNVVVFNSLIDACVRANDLHGAAEVLQEMTGSGVQPDLITFSTLIKGYCSNGELSKAMRLSEELQARELECDEIVYNSLLEGCVKAGDLQLGLRLFTEMRQRCVRPSSVTFSILVKLLSRAGRLDLACHLVSREMREMHGVAPTRMVWSCLVTCAVKARDIPKAVTVLDLLDREGGAVGGARSSMYATVIEGCLVQGEVRSALSLCERAYLRASPEEGTRGLLSADLLRRVFEAVSSKAPETETRQVLDNLAPRLSEQVRASLEDALKGNRRKSPRGGRNEGGSGKASAGRSLGGFGNEDWSPAEGGESLAASAAASAALWPGGVMAAAAQQWPQSNPAPSVGGFSALEVLQGASAPGGYPGAGGGSYPGAGPSWDPAAMAAAMAAAQAAQWGGYGMGMGGADAYGMGMYGGYNADPYGYGQQWQGQSWEQQGLQQWQATAAAAAAAAAPAALASGPGFGVGAREKETPLSPFSPDAGLAQAFSPAAPAFSPAFGGGVETPGSPAFGGSVVKAIGQTPATTAGRSSMLFSPEADDSPVKGMRLFAGDAGRDGAVDQAKAKIEVPLAALLEGPPRLLEGPPGLC